jgi:hypothetical protein
MHVLKGGKAAPVLTGSDLPLVSSFGGSRHPQPTPTVANSQGQAQVAGIDWLAAARRLEALTTAHRGHGALGLIGITDSFRRRAGEKQ